VAPDTVYLGVNSHTPFLWYTSLENLSDHLASFQTSPSPAQSLSYPRPSDSPRPFYRSTIPKHAQRVMDDAEKSEKNEKESPPLQIDPKWYVQHPLLFASLTVDRA